MKDTKGLQARPIIRFLCIVIAACCFYLLFAGFKQENTFPQSLGIVIFSVTLLLPTAALCCFVAIFGRAPRWFPQLRNEEYYFLSGVLQIINNEQQLIKHPTIRKAAAHIVIYVLILLPFALYKFAQMPILYLIVSIWLCAALLTKIHLSNQIRILKPYINTTAIKERINEIQI